MRRNLILKRTQLNLIRFSAAVFVLLVANSAATNVTRADDGRLSLEFVPPDAAYVLSVRAAEFAERPELRDLVRVFDQMAPALAETKLSVRDFREILQIKFGQPQSYKRVVLRFVDASRQKKYLDTSTQWYKMTRVSGTDQWQGDTEKFIQIDPTTLVLDQTTTEGKPFAPLQNPLPPWAPSWQERNDQQVVFALNPRAFLQSHPFLVRDTGQFAFPMFHPLYYKVQWSVGGAEVGDKLRISGIAQCESEKSVENVRDTLQALAVVLQNFARFTSVAQQVEDGKLQTGPQIELRKKAYGVAADALASIQTKTEGSRVRYSLDSSASTKQLADLAVSLAPAVTEAQSAARQAQSINNLRQIALGMLNYEAAKRQLPSTSSYVYFADGKRQRSKYPHSWRVDVLPYMEEQVSQDKYHFDEAWDSEANKKMLAHMPSVFRSAADPDPKSTNTSVFVFTGPGTMFEGEEGTKLRTVQDGTSKTILLVEAKRPVPWTKPDDIPYDTVKPLPKLDRWWPDRILMAMADGSAMTVSADVDEATLRAHITRNGGESVRGLPSPDDKK